MHLEMWIKVYYSNWQRNALLQGGRKRKVEQLVLKSQYLPALAETANGSTANPASG